MSLDIDELYKMNIMRGRVKYGLQIARKLEMPTINIEMISKKNNEYCLEPGIYAGLIHIKNEHVFPSCIYIHPELVKIEDEKDDDEENTTLIYKIEMHVLEVKTESQEEKILNEVMENEIVECKCMKFIRNVRSFKDLSIKEKKDVLKKDREICFYFFINKIIEEKK